MEEEVIIPKRSKHIREFKVDKAKKWSKALRSGEYSQTIGVLQNEKGFCCLGVSCNLFIPKNRLRISEDNFLIGDLPNEQRNAPRWLKEVDGDLEDRLGISFALLNDGKRFNFNEIADIVELVYVHKALD